MKRTDIKVAFIHGRPAAHPFHQKLAESVRADSYFVDFKLKWHGVSVSPLKRYLSWLACAFLFPDRRKYDIFFSEGLHVPPVLMKKLGLLNKRQKIVVLLDNETLYFLHSKRLSPFSHKFNAWLLNSYDKLIISGEMLTEIAHLQAKDSIVRAHTIFNGISAERMARLTPIKPDPESKKILFIGNGPGDWRVWYKGLDMLLDAFTMASGKINNLELTIVGQWEEREIATLMKRVPKEKRHQIHFAGQVQDLKPFLEEAGLYVHCGRGEAFGISILEAMAAGCVPLVSEWTGAKEAVKKVSEELIVPLDTKVFAEKICWFLMLERSRKIELSVKAREVALSYSEEKAIAHFTETFYKAVLS